MNAHRSLRRYRFAASLAAPAFVIAGLLATTGAAANTAAAPPPAALYGSTTSPIQHVVVLMMENQSFDSVLGFWCNQNPGRCPDGGMPSSVALSNGAVVKPSVNPDVVPTVRHWVIDQVNAIDGGKMDGWQNVKDCGPSAYVCISGYQPSQEPNATGLAGQFAISDRFFSLSDAPSWGGHLNIVTGNLDGFTGDFPTPRTAGIGWGCDTQKVAPWAPALGASTQKIPACIPDPSLTYHGSPLPNGGAFAPTPAKYEPTIMDKLNSAGLSWKLYGGMCAQEATAANGLLTCQKTMNAQGGGYDWAICPYFAECLYTQASGMAPTGQFLTDAASGSLPAYSVVTPGAGYAQDSEHNGFSMTAGDNFLGQIASGVMHSPQWSSTALFITWDDCGCFYDQVPPPLNPDGTQQGPRVPLVIVSPYARPAYTDTTPASVASILAFTEQNFGLSPLGPNDAQAYNFSGAFNYAQTPLRPVRMVTRRVPTGDHLLWSQAMQQS